MPTAAAPGLDHTPYSTASSTRGSNGSPARQPPVLPPLALDIRLPPLHPKQAAQLCLLAVGHGSLFAGMSCRAHQQAPQLDVCNPLHCHFWSLAAPTVGDVWMFLVLPAGPTRQGGLLQWGDAEGDVTRPDLPPGVITLPESWLPATEDADAAPSVLVHIYLYLSSTIVCRRLWRRLSVVCPVPG
jgi:hypothetical protein